MADAVGVMYLGRFVEQGDVGDVCGRSRHPYTQSLMAIAGHAEPVTRDQPAIVLEGSIPSPLAIPSGCSFHTRCPLARRIAAKSSATVDTADGRVPRLCAEQAPPLYPALGGGSAAACHFANDRLFDPQPLNL
jgi:oligopeptide/dipeptide ABC transporter ATP-binding protein